MNTTKDHKCPKGVLKALMLLARAVRAVEDLREQPDPDPETEYHFMENLLDMEGMLLNQLVSSVRNEVLREAVLYSAGLESLVGTLRSLAARWEE